MIVKNILVAVISLLLINGCASTAQINKPYSAISSVNSDVFISKKDLSKKYAIYSGVASLLFPIQVDLGKALTEYSGMYLGAVSEIDTASPSVGGVYISIKKFEIPSFSFHAKLEIDVIVKNHDGSQILSKTYTGKGNVVTPNSDAHSVNVRAVSQTSREAFQQVFEKISKDIMNL